MAHKFHVLYLVNVVQAECWHLLLHTRLAYTGACQVASCNYQMA